MIDPFHPSDPSHPFTGSSVRGRHRAHPSAVSASVDGSSSARSFVRQVGVVRAASAASVASAASAYGATTVSASVRRTSIVPPAGKQPS